VEERKGSGASSTATDIIDALTLHIFVLPGSTVFHMYYRPFVVVLNLFIYILQGNVVTAEAVYLIRDIAAQVVHFGHRCSAPPTFLRFRILPFSVGTLSTASSRYHKPVFIP
jgi:hypothetical protein